MSGHDPAPLVVPPLQRKERRPEKREEDLRRIERERERKRPLVSHSTRSKTRYKTRDATQPRPRSSPNLGCRSCRRTSQRDCGYQPQVRDIIDCSLFFSFYLPHSFSLPFSPAYASPLCKSSRKSTRAGTQFPMKPQYKTQNGSERSPTNKNVITAHAIAIYVENCCRAIDQST